MPITNDSKQKCVIITGIFIFIKI